MAISTDYYDVSLCRYIRGDWLDKLNISLPTTIDEFYEASLKFTYDDPDSDGLDNTSGFYIMDLMVFLIYLLHSMLVAIQPCIV